MVITFGLGLRRRWGRKGDAAQLFQGVATVIRRVADFHVFRHMAMLLDRKAEAVGVAAMLAAMELGEQQILAGLHDRTVRGKAEPRE
jgi:hypothetical protein